MRVAVAQFASGIDHAENLATCLTFIARAGRSGADLVVLPEAAMYFDPKRQDGPGQHGQSLDGPFAQAISAAARTEGIAVVAGMLETPRAQVPPAEVTDAVADAPVVPGVAAPGRAEVAPGDRAFNTVLAVSAQGDRLGAYRKIHLYDAFGFRESDTYLPGPIAAPPIFEVAGNRVAVLTCYDLRFPEVFRWVVDAGADLVAVPAAWIVGPGKERHWSTLLAARAIENTVYVAGAGQTGPVCCGHSMIIDPMGAVVAGAGELPDLAIAEIDRARIESVRRTNPSLANRRFTVTPR